MSKITDFFKIAKNNHVQESDQNRSSYERGTVANQFYEHCLTKQDQLCDKVECINRIAALKSELKTMQEKCLNTKEAVAICTEVIAEKDIEINNLMQQLTTAVNSTEPTVTDTPVVSIDDKPEPVVMEPIDRAEASLFSAFQNEFSGDVLSSLRSVENRREKDSHFVNIAMRALYAGNLNGLKNKSVTGRSKSGQRKEPITPEKHRVLKTIYTERIHIVSPECEERAARITRLNKYIKDAIHNITKSIDSNEIENETCHRLINNLNE